MDIEENARERSAVSAGARRSDVAARAGLAGANLGLDLHRGLSSGWCCARERAERLTNQAHMRGALEAAPALTLVLIFILVSPSRGWRLTNQEQARAPPAVAPAWTLDLIFIGVSCELEVPGAQPQPRGKLPAWTLDLIFMCILLFGCADVPRTRDGREAKSDLRAIARRAGFDAGLDLHGLLLGCLASAGSRTACAQPRNHEITNDGGRLE